MTSGATRELHVVGGGGHAKVVIETARAAGWRVVAVYDDGDIVAGQTLLGVPILGPSSQAPRGCPAHIAIGHNRTRKKLAETLRLDWQTLVHPTAWVSPTARLGVGSVIMAGAVVQADAVLGDHVITNTRASVDHDCHIGDYVHVAPGVALCGAVKVGKGSLVGVGASVIPGCEIGMWATVGAGAAVVRPVASETSVVGVPAR